MAASECQMGASGVWMGLAASSEMRKVTASSPICSCPICRLPVRRIITIKNRYITAVRIKIVSSIVSPTVLWAKITALIQKRGDYPSFFIII